MENESTLGDDFAALGKALEDYDLLAAPPPTVAKCGAKFTETVSCTEPAGHSGMHCGSGTLWHHEKPDRARKCNECGLSADDINDLTGEIERLREEIAALRAAIQKAVNPHEFNCGWQKHPDFVKMVPVDGCTCGLDRLLRITDHSAEGKP